MTPHKAGRGRPKGTGLNDAAQLRAIAGLMATNPDLKPTTAIKTLGITDPSVIRRLRDKFSSVEGELIAEIAPQLPLGEVSAVAALVAVPAPVKEAAPASMEAVPAAAALVALQIVAAQAEAARPVPRAVPLAGVRSERKIQPAKAVEVQKAPFVPTPVPPRPERPRHFPLPSQTGLSDLMGMGLSLYALSVEAQFAVVGLMFQWPPLSAVLKSQVAFTEVAVAMTKPAMSSSLKG
ncbi:MAG: hypothetical protein ABL901_18320 [Hyphomicrobiaceae bacterium]